MANDRQNIPRDTDRQRGAEWQTTFDAIGDMVLLLDKDFVVVKANHAAELFLSLAREKIIGRHCYELVHNTPVPPEFCPLAKLKLSKKHEQAVFFMAEKGLWLDVRVDPLFDELGELQGAVHVVRDITQRKQAEEERQKTLSLLEAALESTADGLLVADGQGKMVRFNKKFLEMWRIPEQVVSSGSDEAALKYVLDQLVVPDQFLRKVKELYQRPEEVSFDVLAFKDGRTFERYSQPQRIGQEIVGRVWSFRDVTERARVEEDLRRSKEFSDTLVASAPNIIVGLGVGSEILVFNKFAERLTGYAAAEVLGRSWIELFIPEAIRPEIKSVWDKIVEQRMIQHHYDNPIVTRDGRELLIAWDNTVLTAGNEFKMVLSIGEDVTELRQLEQAKETLFRNISHKLKSPLAMMTMGMDLWRSGLAKMDEKKMRQAVELISKHLSITSRDINSIITFFTLTAGQRSLPKETVSLNAVIKEIIYDLQPLAEEQIVTLSNDIPLDDLPVLAVAGEMKILFHNLIENAVKFTERGDVTVKAEAGVDGIKVLIKDTGRGLTKAELSQLGKEFYQHNPEVKGLGLGLVISQEIAQRHGGEVRLDSSGMGKGTTVTVSLPKGGNNNGA